MTHFSYQAVDKEGKSVNGNIDANSKSNAKQQLVSQDYIVYSIKEIQTKKSSRSIPAQHKSLFTRQLATLLNAGFTLEKALKSCAKQRNSKSAPLINSIYNKVVEGLPFYQVLSEYPKVFDHTFCATIKAGEHSGHLDAILDRLADHDEAKMIMRESIRQAMIYPIILFVVSSIMIGYLVTSVIPNVVEVFHSSGQELPGITQALINISHIIRHQGIYIVIVLAILFFLLRQLFKKENWKLKKHQFTLQTPLIGNIVRHYHAANYSSTLSVLLTSGVTLVDALKISAQTISNLEIKKVAENAYEEVQKGHSLAKSLMTKKHTFPDMLIELIDSGEQSATLPSMLEKASDIFQKQSQSRLKTLTGLLGPLMILLMGGIIFVIVLAILLPIFDLNQAIK